MNKLGMKNFEPYNCGYLATICPIQKASIGRTNQTPGFSSVHYYLKSCMEARLPKIRISYKSLLLTRVRDE